MSANPIISGVICEYNPFHYGHNALIEQTRRNGSYPCGNCFGWKFRAEEENQPALRKESELRQPWLAESIWCWSFRFPGPWLEQKPLPLAAFFAASAGMRGSAGFWQ